MELSEPVAGAVDEAVQVILGLAAEAGRATTGHGTAAAEDPEIRETTGEGVSHVPWHSR